MKKRNHPFNHPHRTYIVNWDACDAHGVCFFRGTMSVRTRYPTEADVGSVIRRWAEEEVREHAARAADLKLIVITKVFPL